MSFAALPALPGRQNDSHKIFVLDASATLRFLDREAGGDRVFDIFRLQNQGKCSTVASSLHWGEVASVLLRRSGIEDVERMLSNLILMGIQIVPATGDRAVRSAHIQNRLKIPYVDAFGVELAGDSLEHIFVTADYDLKPAASEVQIEFLLVK